MSETKLSNVCCCVYIDHNGEQVSTNPATHHNLNGSIHFVNISHVPGALMRLLVDSATAWSSFFYIALKHNCHWINDTW